MSLGFVGIKSEFTFKQETTTSLSGKVYVREAGRMQYAVGWSEGGLEGYTIFIT